MAANLSSTFDQNISTTLPELLDQSGFSICESFVNTFILPPINLMGLGFCSFSLWIFSQRSFSDPKYLYYRLLCLVNIIHLLHNIPGSLSLALLYFPSSISTHAIAMYQVYYVSVSNFLFHFGDVLQMGILLNKLTFFSPLVQAYFKGRPKVICLVFFLTCLCIDLPFVFVFKIDSFGNYAYVDSNFAHQMSTFYFLTLSNFSQTLLGKITIGFTGVFLNQILSLLIGIILNIFSYIKFKSYKRKKQRENEELEMSSIYNRPTINREMEQINQRERNERKIERNMFLMALTLGSISILSRALLIACYAYLYMFYSISNLLIILIIGNSVFTLTSTVSLFIFYLFYKMFRDEANMKLFGL
jgi:hypothetical protein